LREPQLRAGAVSDNDVDPARGECSDGGILTFDGSVICWAADNLLRFFIQDFVASGAQCIGAAEHLPGVVAGRIGLWGRSAELDRRIEQALEKVCGRQADLWDGDTAQSVAREHRDTSCAAVSQQLEGVSHICRREQVGMLTFLDPFAE
jgi:hypothetical protein